MTGMNKTILIATALASALALGACQTSSGGADKAPPKVEQSPLASAKTRYRAEPMATAIDGRSWPYKTASELALRYSDPIYSSYTAAEKLATGAKFNLDPRKKILIASAVDIDDVGKSSTFGRILSEHVASRLSQLGFQVTEVKARQGTVLIERRNGEFLLSRDAKSISLKHDAQAVFVATYAAAQKTVYVSVRLLRAVDGVILSSYDYRLEMTGDVRQLLGRNGGGERHAGRMTAARK